MGKWRYSSTHSELRHTMGWVVSFTPRSLYLREKCPWCNGTWIWMGARSRPDTVEKRKSLASVGIRTSVLRLSSLGPATIPTKLFWLFLYVSIFLILNRLSYSMVIMQKTVFINRGLIPLYTWNCSSSVIVEIKIEITDICRGRSHFRRKSPRITTWE
jgi:hypothetical protein